jgi:hypothetical protein
MGVERLRRVPNQLGNEYYAKNHGEEDNHAADNRKPKGHFHNDLPP